MAAFVAMHSYKLEFRQEIVINAPDAIMIPTFPGRGRRRFVVTMLTHVSTAYNDTCAYRSRLKGLIMYGFRDRYTDRDHNGSGALVALQELNSSRVTFEKDVAAIIRSLNGEPAKGYR